MRENEKKRRGTTFSTCRSRPARLLSLSPPLFPIFLFSFISSPRALLFFQPSFSLFSFFLRKPPFVRQPTSFRSSVILFKGRIAATGGFSSRHRVTLYPFRFIYIFPLRFSVRTARMNNKIMPTARRQLFGLDATLERIRSTPSFIPRIRAVIARLARDSKTNIPHDWNTMNYEGRSSWKHR